MLAYKDMKHINQHLQGKKQKPLKCHEEKRNLHNTHAHSITSIITLWLPNKLPHSAEARKFIEHDNKNYASSMLRTPGWTRFPEWRSESMCSCCFVAFACCEAQCCTQYNSMGLTTPGVDRLPIVSCKHAVSKQFLLQDITRKACSKASISATLSLDVPFNLCTAGCSHWPVQDQVS